MWIVGVATNICGSVLINLGTNLMKHGHNIEARSNGMHQKHSLFSSIFIWRLGVGCFVSGSLINFSSFAFAAQTLLAALGGVQFLSNVFFARFILKEQLTVRVLVATSLIVSGLVCSVGFSNHSDKSHTAEELEALYDIHYCRFIVVTGIVLVGCEVLYRWYTIRERDSRPLPFSSLIRPVCYCFVSATVGTQGVLQSKSIAELLSSTSHIRQIHANNYFIYMVILVLISCLSFWVYRLNQALKLFDGLLVIPLLQAFWTTTAIIQGGIFFKEFSAFSALQMSGFWMGVVVVMVGVSLLARSPASYPLALSDDINPKLDSEISNLSMNMTSVNTNMSNSSNKKEDEFSSTCSTTSCDSSSSSGSSTGTNSTTSNNSFVNVGGNSPRPKRNVMGQIDIGGAEIELSSPTLSNYNSDTFLAEENVPLTWAEEEV